MTLGAALVRRGQLAGWLEYHVGVMALDHARSGLGAQHHSATRFAPVSSSKLVGHERLALRSLVSWRWAAPSREILD